MAAPVDPDGPDDGPDDGPFGDLFDPGDAAPICPACGVTALPGDDGAGGFVCENPDCPAFGDPV